MAYFDYTYTLTNGTTADASQVQQNFTDAKNGVTDGTKDLNVAAITAAGAVIFNGNTTVGSATNDDITLNGSVASTVNVKTHATYDIGSSTSAFRYLYLGNSTNKTTALVSQASTSYSFTFPSSGGTSRYRMLTNGSGVTSFEEARPVGGGVTNYSITAVADSGAHTLTISVLGADGNALSSSNVLECSFRSSTSATGTPALRTATSISSLVISSGSTLGHASGVGMWIFIYLLDNAGTIELAACSTLLDEGIRQSSTAEGGAGAADSISTLYSTTARSNVGIRLIGRMLSSQTVAGTWDSAVTIISLLPFTPEVIASRFTSNTSQSMASGSATIIDFEDKSTDPYNAVTVGSSWKFTAPQGGYYSVKACARLDPSSVVVDLGDAMNLRLYKNGSLVSILGGVVGQVNSLNLDLWISGSDDIRLSAGDYIDVRLYHDIGTSVSTTGNAEEQWVSIVKVGN